MRTIIAIDPGSTESGVVVTCEDDGKYQLICAEKVDNNKVMQLASAWTMGGNADIVCEMIGHYGTGMSAGKTVFDTCIWIGRFIESSPVAVHMMLRPTVKAHICGSAKAKDANVIQALKDRFGDRGTKAAPGFFYGIKADAWQAFALAVAYCDGAKVLHTWN